MNGGTVVNRRSMLAGGLGLGVAATLGIGAARAQDEAATPAAGTDNAGKPEGTGERPDAATMLAEAIEQANQAITLAQQDRDAAGAAIDPTTVDALLAQATAWRDAAQAVTEADVAAVKSARLAAVTARAAGQLVEAQVAAYGLPSQQARTSQLLARAHEEVKSAGDDAAVAANADAATFVTTAEALYAAAFAAYGTGTYAQAGQTGRVAAEVARIGVAVATPAESLGGRGGRGGMGGGKGRGGMGRGGGRPGNGDVGGDGGRGGMGGFGDGMKGGRGGRRGRGGFGGETGGPDEERPSTEPVEVPEPTF